jgi:hypothetical protein
MISGSLGNPSIPRVETTVPFTATSNTPEAPTTNRASTPSAFLIASAARAARGR